MIRRLGFLLSALALVSVLSCAYYNIFWMAKSDYKKAVESGDYDFWDPYDQPGLKGDAQRLVDSCIERCGKLLLLHPGSKWVDDALLTMGNCFVLRGENQNALRKYDEILQLYASSDRVPMARYMKAYTLIRAGSVQQGATLLSDVSEDKEHKDIRQRAVYLSGRIAHERDDCSQAIQVFETYLADFPKGAKVGKVRLYLAACLLRLDRAEEVINVLDPLAKREGQDALQAALKTGEAYRHMGRNDRAIEIFTRLTERAAEDSVRARAKMEIAKTMVARGETQEAVTVLDEAAEIATASLSNLRDEIVYTQGLVHEKNLLDFDTAIASYDKIAKSRSGYGEKAKKRAEALKAIQQFTGALGDTLPDTPEEEALNRFKLGETYLEELGLRDEAFVQFRTVADSFPDTEFAPRAMLRTAVLLDAESDSLAEAYYRRVIEVSPGSVHANFARSHLGLPLVDVEIERPDTMAIWEAGLVVGPPLPGADRDSLSADGPAIPGPHRPGRAPADTAGVGRRRPPDSTGTAAPDDSTETATPPDTIGTLDPPDTTETATPADTARTAAPQDTTGQDRRRSP